MDQFDAGRSAFVDRQRALHKRLTDIVHQLDQIRLSVADVADQVVEVRNANSGLDDQ